MSIIVKIKKKFNRFVLDADFELSEGSMGILGASGSGKSLTLKCITGVIQPDEGIISVGGKTVFDSIKGIHLKPQERNIGMVFQNYALFPHMTVAENIGISLPKTAERKYLVQQMLESFHLTQVAQKYPYAISGGQQQRVALARALVKKPDVLLLDEPFSALDVHLKERMQDEVMSYLEDFKGDVIMVSHSRDEIYRMCPEMLIMENGRSILKGGTSQLFARPQFQSVAQLTGCKNFSTANPIDAGHVMANEWGIALKVDSYAPEILQSIGIRAHDFKLAPPENRESHNTFPVKIVKTIVDVFEYSHYFEFASPTPSPAHMLFKVNKQTWDQWAYKNDVYLTIAPESVLLLQNPLD